MTTQLDMFAASAPTFPPHLDPAKVDEVRCFAGIDRDHVGVEAIGRVGNNREVWTVKVYGFDAAVLWAETFDERDQAETRREEILLTLKRNAQAFLNL